MLQKESSTQKVYFEEQIFTNAKGKRFQNLFFLFLFEGRCLEEVLFWKKKKLKKISKKNLIS